jgi:hypothetical protein
MIPGFNHNIKHKGRIYHVQTEDSGPKNPHIITHVFVGGNIIASKKTDYAELLAKPDYERTVRSMMEEQHKQMLRNLVNGVYDTVETGTAYHLDGPPPVNFTATSPTTTAIAGQAAFKGLPSQAAPGAVATPEHYRPAGGIAVSSTPAGAAASAPAPVAVTPAEPPKSTPPPAVPPGTIFGEDLISEKSLDEVILSYLAEDLADT